MTTYKVTLYRTIPQYSAEIEVEAPGSKQAFLEATGLPDITWLSGEVKYEGDVTSPGGKTTTHFA